MPSASARTRQGDKSGTDAGDPTQHDMRAVAGVGSAAILFAHYYCNECKFFFSLWKNRLKTD